MNKEREIVISADDISPNMDIRKWVQSRMHDSSNHLPTTEQATGTFRGIWIWFWRGDETGRRGDERKLAIRDYLNYFHKFGPQGSELARWWGRIQEGGKSPLAKIRDGTQYEVRMARK